MCNMLKFAGYLRYRHGTAVEYTGVRVLRLLHREARLPRSRGHVQARTTVSMNVTQRAREHKSKRTQKVANGM